MQVSYDYDTGRITTFLISTQHQEDTSVMDIHPLAEAVMETAGKIKNDNMSDQDFYKFLFDEQNLKTLGRRGDRILCVLSSYIRVDIIALWQIPLYNVVRRKGLSL